MTHESIISLLGWSALINYGVLLLWFGMMVFAKPSLRALHGRWFHLTDNQFDAIQYGAMAFYKLLVIVFNIVPYLILKFIV